MNQNKVNEISRLRLTDYMRQDERSDRTGSSGSHISGAISAENPINPPINSSSAVSNTIIERDQSNSNFEKPSISYEQPLESSEQPKKRVSLFKQRRKKS